MNPSRPPAWLLALLIFAAALALYARSAGFPFVEFDDPGYVRDNPHLSAGLDAHSLRWALTSTGYQYNWHPLTWLSHGLDLQLFGRAAGRHHLVNALLHALAAALLFLALRSATKRPGASAFVAALFALHPLRVESVAWIAQRKDVLSGLCFALTLLAYARYARAPSLARYGLVVLALGAGLMAKPTLVTLPCLLLLLDAWPLGRFAPGRWRHLVLEKLPLCALSLGTALLTLAAQRAGGALEVAIPLQERLANAALTPFVYLRQFVLPMDLAVLYPHPALVVPARARALEGGLAALALAVLSLLLFRQRRARPWLLVGWCWFLGLLVPMIGLVQVGNQAHADRYAYLALLGIELALVWSAAELGARRPAFARVLPALGLAWLAGLALVSWRQLDTWRSSEALFTRALEVTTGNFVAHNNLGQVLGNEGRLDEAVAQFEAARAARPGFFEAELNLGKARYARAEFDAARAALERAVKARATSGEAELCLAATLARLGEWTAADAALARALEIEPALVDDARARRLGGELEERLGADAAR